MSGEDERTAEKETAAAEARRGGGEKNSWEQMKNEQTNERTNERTNEQNKRTNERTNERMTERTRPFSPGKVNAQQM